MKNQINSKTIENSESLPEGKTSEPFEEPIKSSQPKISKSHESDAEANFPSIPEHSRKLSTDGFRLLDGGMGVDAWFYHLKIIQHHIFFSFRYRTWGYSGNCHQSQRRREQLIMDYIYAVRTALNLNQKDLHAFTFGELSDDGRIHTHSLLHVRDASSEKLSQILAVMKEIIPKEVEDNADVGLAENSAKAASYSSKSKLAGNEKEIFWTRGYAALIAKTQKQLGIFGKDLTKPDIRPHPSNETETPDSGQFCANEEAIQESSEPGVSISMKLNEPEKTAYEKLIEIEVEILGKTELVTNDVVCPTDILGIGLGWSHFATASQTDTGFFVISTINANADYSMVIAFGDEASDLTPAKQYIGGPDFLFLNPEPLASMERLIGNLALRLAQIGVENTGNHLPERHNPLTFECPFNITWCEILMKQDYGNGITVIAGIDATGKNCFVYFQSPNEIFLNPGAIRFANLRKAPKRRIDSPIYNSPDFFDEEWFNKHAPIFPTWFDETEFRDIPDFEPHQPAVARSISPS